jgi:ribonuclease-3
MEKKLEEILNYSFRDQELLKTAMVHKSYHEGHVDQSLDNERLEFLGDAVIDLIISNYLYQRFSEMNEGDLSKIKAHLVSAEILHRIGEGLKLGDFIRLGRGEEKNRGRQNRKIIASFFEALIGAVYLDAGFDSAREKVIDLYQPVFSDLLKNKIRINDYKSELQEYVQKKGDGLPMYSIKTRRGENREPLFTATVYLENKNAGSGVGKSKREAEQKAAYEALLKLGKKARYRKLSEVFLIKHD